MVINDSFRQLKIFIKDTELCTDNMHILPSPTNFLKYIEIWDSVVSLFNKNTSKNFRYNIEYIRPKISKFNKNYPDINKRLKKGNYDGALILSIDSICETTSGLYPQIFLKKLFGCNNNTLIDISSAESSDESNN